MPTCLPVYPSACPNRTRIPLDGFLWNFILEYFSKLCLENSSSNWSLTRITGTLHKDLYKFSSLVLKMYNVSDRFVEKIKTHVFMYSNFFFENRAVYEIMWKNMVEPDRPQVTVWRMLFARWILNILNILRICNIYCFFHWNNDCTNAPWCYVPGTLRVLLLRLLLHKPFRNLHLYPPVLHFEVLCKRCLKGLRKITNTY